MLRVRLPRYVSRRAILNHVNGVTDEVVDEDFLAKIVDFSNFWITSECLQRQIIIKVCFNHPIIKGMCGNPVILIAI